MYIKSFSLPLLGTAGRQHSVGKNECEDHVYVSPYKLSQIQLFKLVNVVVIYHCYIYHIVVNTAINISQELASMLDLYKTSHVPPIRLHKPPGGPWFRAATLYGNTYLYSSSKWRELRLSY
jgi:hypothetical protein